METAVTPAAQGWAGLLSEQRGEAKQPFDQYGTAERLRRWREFDPEAAAQVEQKRRKLSVRSASDEGVSPTR